MKKINRRNSVIAILAVVIIALATAFTVYINQYYHSEDVAYALQSTEEVKVNRIRTGYFFDGRGTEKALIFYPGGKVEATAYAPMLQKLASEGMDCFLVEMPGNLAVFGVNKANQIMDAYDYDSWYMAGHSLGGAMASAYTGEHPDKVSGLALLAAYSTKDLSAAKFPVLIMYGEHDRVLNRESFEKYKANLPAETKIIEISGGNHDHFGNYGDQKGDGRATISAEEQQEAVIDQILSIF